MTPLVDATLSRRYADLVQLGRSRLPGFAPDWTDHNAHDPGITLMELLAWVAEAQLYSVSRSRTDERAAYAAMFDVVPGGTRAAQGVIWPDRGDSSSPWSVFSESAVLDTDTAVRLVDQDVPEFRPTHRILWVPARIAKLESQHPDGRVEDLTRVNERGGSAYAPFGDVASGRDRLVMSVEVRGNAGLFPKQRSDALGAHLALGVRTEDSPQGDASEESRRRSPLEVTLVAGANRYPLAVVEDSTEGLLRTGAVILALDAVVPQIPTTFALEIRAPQGFVRPPRLLRIEPCVLPITQQHRVNQEPHPALMEPDQSFVLDVAGLSYEAGHAPPVELIVDDSNTTKAWSRRERLSECGPDDKVYALDEGTGRITFGNGINGAMPPAGSTIRVSYRVSDGAHGNTARNRRWRVTGFAGMFGVNPDAIGGGFERADDIAVRRDARHGRKEHHALISADDIVDAAMGLPLLGVGRAWIVPRDKRPQSGSVMLVAMRQRDNGIEPVGTPESRRWLQAIQSALAPRMPLGTRLVVVAPQYIDFRIRASVVPERGRDPDALLDDMTRALRKRLALVPSRPGQSVRPTGVPLSRYEVGAWIRGVDGVADVQALDLVRDRTVVDDIVVRSHALPRLDLEPGDITVLQSALAATP